MFIKLQSCLKAVDVTWRYSPKHDEICRRRLLVSEEWLDRALGMLNCQVSVDRNNLHCSTPQVHIGYEIVQSLNNQ